MDDAKKALQKHVAKKGASDVDKLRALQGRVNNCAQLLAALNMPTALKAAKYAAGMASLDKSRHPVPPELVVALDKAATLQRKAAEDAAADAAAAREIRAGAEEAEAAVAAVAQTVGVLTLDAV